MLVVVVVMRDKSTIFALSVLFASILLASTALFSSSAFASSCAPQWINSYTCSGNYRQQTYQYSDCSTAWLNVQYCQYGCSSGSCQGGPIIYPPTYPSGCAASVSLTTPADVYQGDYVSSTVTVTNVGNTGGTVTLNGYLCRADGTNCQQIYCGNSMSSSVYVPAQSAVSVACGVRTGYGYYSGTYYNYPYNYDNYPYNYPYNYYPPYTSPTISSSSSIQPIYGYSSPYYCDGTYYSNFQINPCYYNPYSGYYYEPLSNYNYYGNYNYNYYNYNAPSGSYRIKVDWGGCGVSDPTLYSGAFAILPYDYQACTAQFVDDNYRCDGNWRQQLYQDSDCRTYYKNVNFCSSGCSDGICKPASTTTTTTTSAASAPTATATTTSTVYWPAWQTGWQTGNWPSGQIVLPGSNTLLAILLLLLIIILVILLSDGRTRKSFTPWRGEEEKFQRPPASGFWRLNGFFRGRVAKEQQ